MWNTAAMVKPRTAGRQAASSCNRMPSPRLGSAGTSNRLRRSAGRRRGGRL